MHGLHIATDVEAWPASGVAEEVDHVLADALLRIRAGAFEESADLGISGQAADEIVRDGGKGIISAQTLVQRWLLRECGTDQS